MRAPTPEAAQIVKVITHSENASIAEKTFCSKDTPKTEGANRTKDAPIAELSPIAEAV